MMEKLASALGKVAKAIGAPKEDGGVDKTVAEASKQAEKGFEFAVRATVLYLTGHDPQLPAFLFDPLPLTSLPRSPARAGSPIPASQEVRRRRRST